MRRLVLVVSGLCLIGVHLFGEVPQPILSSLEGEVSLVRQALPLAAREIVDGLAVQNFDTISTGPTGRLDVRFRDVTGWRGSVSLDSNSTIYVDWGTSDEPRSTIVLISGSVTTNVSSVASDFPLEIRTDRVRVGPSVPGVRVVSSPDTAILVTSRGGAVVCETDSQTLWAQSWTAVEWTGSNGLSSIPSNPATLSTFEANWRAKRIETLASASRSALALDMRSFLRQLAVLSRAEERYRLVEADDKRGLALAACSLWRAALPVERKLALVSLIQDFVDQGRLPVETEISRGFTLGAFLDRFHGDLPNLQNQLVQARSEYWLIAQVFGPDYRWGSEPISVSAEGGFLQ